MVISIVAKEGKSGRAINKKGQAKAIAEHCNGLNDTSLLEYRSQVEGLLSMGFSRQERKKIEAELKTIEQAINKRGLHYGL